MAYGDAHQIKSIRAKHDEVIVRDMDFNDRTLASGILLADDNYKSEGIRPRWGQIYVVGPKQTRFKPGQWICVSHGRWTRGVKIADGNGETVIRKVDNADILLVSDDDPGNDDTLADAIDIYQR